MGFAQTPGVALYSNVGLSQSHSLHGRVEDMETPSEQAHRGRTVRSFRVGLARRQQVSPNPCQFRFHVVQVHRGGVCQADQGVLHSGVVFLGHQWQELLPDAVAGELEEEIAAVLPVGAAQLVAVFHRFRLGGVEEGTKDKRGIQTGGPGPGGGLRHPPQAVEPGAAHYVKQHRFRQVVGGVPDGNGWCADVVGHVSEEPVSHFPGSLLEGGDAMFALVGDGVLLVHAEGQAQFPRQGFDEPRVFVRLLASEVVVEVGYVQGESQGFPQVIQAVE